MTALFTTPRYTGLFATINHQPDRGYVVTLWQCGRPIRYTPHVTMFEATLEVVAGGMGWANEKMQVVFEEDVLIAGDER